MSNTGYSKEILILTTKACCMYIFISACKKLHLIDENLHLINEYQTNSTDVSIFRLLGLIIWCLLDQKGVLGAAVNIMLDCHQIQQILPIWMCILRVMLLDG